jgi:hypothetical protein
MRRERPGGERGFSLLEAVIATGLTLAVTAAVFSVVNPAQGAFAAEPEIADMQQRLRVATGVLSKSLSMAGAGPYAGEHAGPLSYVFAPVLPFRQGATNRDAAGTFATDRITLVYVPPTHAQTTLSAALAPASPVLHVARESGCPVNDSLCGFSKDMSVLVYDDTGNYGLFTITGVVDDAGQLLLNTPADAAMPAYPVGARVVEAASDTYFLKTAPASQTYQLMHYDGTSAADVPVVDNVVGLSFDYYGDPSPPLLKKPASDSGGPWTTYGPKPPALGVKTTAYPAGENCVFVTDGVTQTPRLATLGGGDQTLVKLTAAQLTDGPWCPDATSRNRYDADLLRIRKVAVTLRVQAAAAALRGPAGALFARAGTSQGGTRWVPDQEIRFQVSPRNLNLGR